MAEIGFAGNDKKVRILKKELKFDHAFNYKPEMHIKRILKKVAPNGIDVFFDNVGGSLRAGILECMKNTGCIPFFGAISEYSKVKNKNPVVQRTSFNTKSFNFTQWH